jgi:hypothetical protein
MDSELPSESKSLADSPIILALGFAAIAVSTTIPWMLGIVTTNIAMAGVALVAVASAGGAIWFAETARGHPMTRGDRGMVRAADLAAVVAFCTSGFYILGHELSVLAGLFLAIFAGLFLLRRRVQAERAQNLEVAP